MDKRNASKGGKHLKEKERTKSSAILPSLPVIIAFAVVTVMAWLIPLRPTMSETEKRNLERFPQFSVSALLDGSYFDDIGVWFSDTFTFRETWIDTATGLETLYGSKTVAIYGEIGEVDDIPDITVSVPVEENNAPVRNETAGGNGTSAPEGQSDVAEPDALEQEPSGGETTSVADGTQTDAEGGSTEIGQDAGNDDGAENTDEPDGSQEEAFDPRQEGEVEDSPEDATESSWGGQMIEEDEYVGTSAVIQIGNATYAFTGFSQYNADRYIASMNKTAELLDGKARVFTVLGLENTTFMLTREDRIAMGCKPEEDAVAYMYSQIDPRINKVSVFDNLVAHNSEYLAFRTDHHWTATGAYYAYEAWCHVAGVDPVPLEDYEVIEYPGFYGSYYAKAAKSHLLEEDTVVCYVPPGNVTLYLNDGNGDGLGWEQALITNRTNSSAGSKYLAFLAGDHARGTFINDDITDGSSCLVIKTSVGNPFVYYMTQHYQYVYVIDIRYYFGRSLTSFVEHFEIDDVIFMHGAGLAMGTGGNNLFENFVK